MQKGTTGTHYLADAKRKTRTVMVRMTDADYETICRKADAADESVSAFLRLSALRRRVKPKQAHTEG